MRGNSPVQSGFRYEAMWLRAADYKGVVEEAWSSGSEGGVSLQVTWSNLNRLATSLRDWSKASFGSVRKEILRLEKKLKYLRSCTVSEEVICDERATEKELCELFEREEIMARQRSRVEWLQEGDRNMTFFHARASARRKTNRIKKLVRDDGTRCEDQTGMKGMVEDFFGRLFTAETCVSIDEDKFDRNFAPDFA
ncbi:hypothetical protein ACQ4PT_002684 [Festuca glaucescens]